MSSCESMAKETSIRSNILKQNDFWFWFAAGFLIFFLDFKSGMKTDVNQNDRDNYAGVHDVQDKTIKKGGRFFFFEKCVYVVLHRPRAVI